MTATPPVSAATYAYHAGARTEAAVRTLIELTKPSLRGASLSVHPADDMFAFGVAAIGAVPLATMAYFRAGMQIADTMTAIADWHFGGMEHVGSVLDFAAGYGRSTRFLVQELSPDRVTVAEIQRDALAFQAREFGVATMVSTGDPLGLDTSRTFDFVFVASLFTHLPDATFASWLQRIWELVAPGGVLAFSVHDESMKPDDIELVDGFGFRAASEVAELDTDEYGTNITTEAYVRERLNEAVGVAAGEAVRMPRALCFDQDVWIVTRGERNPREIDYDRGPSGAVDRLALSGRTLEISGWAADLGVAADSAAPHQISRVAVHLGGTVVGSAATGLPRPDIGAHFRRPTECLLNDSGWSTSIRLTRRARPSDLVAAVATCEHGHSFVLDATSVEDALARMGQPPLLESLLRGRLATVKRLFSQGGATAVIKRAAIVGSRDLRAAAGRRRSAAGR